MKPSDIFAPTESLSHSKLLLWALIHAQHSPDPSTQNGALLATKYDAPVAFTGSCNEFPTGVKYSAERWDRPTKYSFIEHAERNAIFAAARQGIATQGKTLVCGWAACADCARAMVQAGIVRLIRLPKFTDALATTERWKDSVDVGDTIMIEGGIEIVEAEIEAEDRQFLPTLRRDGKAWSA